ncbi:hypothetical protein [Glycomyces buryatensis]|uniref:Uncharacterized protein n=1 Tax=Glycomyces buryatensis TaxID=2570927 RepID=A0A4S8QBJ7_9ACTN|nr:hypothetical protein [Glycomyces buryatensis]THV41913.1 hypothetical protein FAB82_09350 [Glycomyces buryatensis]
MPTFQQAIDADPSQFLTLGESVVQAVGELTETGVKFAESVAGLATSWQGNDYQGLVGHAGEVGSVVARSDAALLTAAAGLESMGTILAATQMALKTTKQVAEGIGYMVLPTPMVILGPGQWSLVSSAGPEAPAILAAYQAGAAVFTDALGSMYTTLIDQDTVAYGMLRAAISQIPK